MCPAHAQDNTHPNLHPACWHAGQSRYKPIHSRSTYIDDKQGNKPLQTSCNSRGKPNHDSPSGQTCHTTWISHLSCLPLSCATSHTFVSSRCGYNHTTWVSYLSCFPLSCATCRTLVSSRCGYHNFIHSDVCINLWDTHTLHTKRPHPARYHAQNRVTIQATCITTYITGRYAVKNQAEPNLWATTKHGKTQTKIAAPGSQCKMPWDVSWNTPSGATTQLLATAGITSGRKGSRDSGHALLSIVA
jgi:hypothetical protein